MSALKWVFLLALVCATGFAFLAACNDDDDDDGSGQYSCRQLCDRGEACGTSCVPASDCQDYCAENFTLADLSCTGLDTCEQFETCLCTGDDDDDDDNDDSGDDDADPQTPEDCYPLYGDPELYFGCVEECTLNVTCIANCLFDLSEQYQQCLEDTGGDEEDILCLQMCVGTGRACLNNCGGLDVFCAGECIYEYADCATACNLPTPTSDDDDDATK